MIREFLDRVFDAFTSQPRIFHSSVRHVVGPERRNFIGQYRPHVQGLIGAEDRIDVAGKNPGLEPIRRVVDHVEGLVELLIPGEGDDRAEDFFAGKFHALVHVGQDRGANYRPFTRPARSEPCALLDGFPDPGLHPDSRAFVDQRTDDRGIPGGIPGRQGFHERDQPVEKGVIHVVVEIDALDGNAGLSGIRESARDASLGGQVQVGIGFDDDRGIASQFEQDPLFPCLVF